MTAAIIPFPAARRAAPPQPKPVYTQWRIGDMISFYDVAENEHRGNISTLYDPGIYAEFLIAVVTCDDGINRRAHLPKASS